MPRLEFSKCSFLVETRNFSLDKLSTNAPGFALQVSDSLIRVQNIANLLAIHQRPSAVPPTVFDQSVEGIGLRFFMSHARDISLSPYSSWRERIILDFFQDFDIFLAGLFIRFGVISKNQDKR